MSDSDRRLPVVQAPWFAEGVRFECRPDCGACCTNHDDYSYVYLEPEDITVLAAHLELSEPDFLEEYTATEDGYVFLKMDDPDCMFLDGEKRCAIYAARPRQCRTFPFWPDNPKSRKNWRKLCAFCPGIDRGRLHGPAEIEERLREYEGCDEG